MIDSSRISLIYLVSMSTTRLWQRSFGRILYCPISAPENEKGKVGAVIAGALQRLDIGTRRTSKCMQDSGHSSLIAA